MTTVLVVEDEHRLRAALKVSLTHHGYDVVLRPNGTEGIRAATGLPAPDVVLLDLGLPDVDGMSLLRELRRTSAVPVIVVTARDTTPAMIEALDAGADDYVTKPFDTGVLLARLRAVVRRLPAHPRVEVVGDLEIDLERRTVRHAGTPVPLTKKERRLLEVLVENGGRLCTHEVLLRTVWGEAYGTETTYLRTYVRQLRRKLGDDAAAPRLIGTEQGLGYRWLPGLDARTDETGDFFTRT